jgi:hypothetical protein
VTIARARWKRALSALLLPASIVPFALVGPGIVKSYRSFDRRHNSAPLPPPAVRLSAAQRHRFKPVVPYSGVVPVLVYHGIGDRDDGYSVTRRNFAEQMAALRQMRFQAIDIRQYVRFRRGLRAGLPPRPILITFDDGRLDSYRGADRILARIGFRATIFVITDQVERKNPFYLTWDELHRMADSGRWDVQPHADKGHVRVAYDRRGRTAPFYAVRRYTHSGGREDFADYEERVTSDVFAARDALKDQGFEPLAFAVPYGDYGQRSGGDRRIPSFMGEFLRRLFGAVFVEDERNAPDYSRPTGMAARYEVHSATTADQLYMWLRDHSPEGIARQAARRRAERQRAHAHRRR